jgi:hypothetical protein
MTSKINLIRGSQWTLTWSEKPLKWVEVGASLVVGFVGGWALGRFLKVFLK